MPLSYTSKPDASRRNLGVGQFMRPGSRPGNYNDTKRANSGASYAAKLFASHPAGSYGATAAKGGDPGLAMVANTLKNKAAMDFGGHTLTKQFLAHGASQGFTGTASHGGYTARAKMRDPGLAMVAGTLKNKAIMDFAGHTLTKQFLAHGVSQGYTGTKSHGGFTPRGPMRDPGLAMAAGTKFNKAVMNFGVHSLEQQFKAHQSTASFTSTKAYSLEKQAAALTATLKANTKPVPRLTMPATWGQPSSRSRAAEAQHAAQLALAP